MASQFSSTWDTCLSSQSAAPSPDTLLERLCLAIDAAKIGIWDWHLTTDQVFWNHHHEQLFGYLPGQPLRTHSDWIQRVHPDDRARVEATMQAALKECQPCHCEYRIVHPDGQVYWVESFGQAHFDSTGQPVRMVGTVTDITTRKQTEAALRQSEELAQWRLAEIEALYATAPIGLCFLDTQFRYRRINQYLAEINGLPVEAHVGHTVREILPELGEVQEPYFRQVLQTGVPILDIQICGKTPAQPGVERVWLVSYYPLQQADGTALGINIVAQEITERQQSELALQERNLELTRLNSTLTGLATLLDKRNRELDQFAYIVSHDLKAPLRGIANLSQWLEEDLQSSLPPEGQEQLRLLRQRVQRMNALVDGLLQYSRLERSEAEVETVDVEKLLRDIVDLLNPPATFTIELAPNLPVLLAKRLRLEQVFTNLIGNAIKHHPRLDGRVRVSVADQGDFYAFAVSDDGAGIAPEFHDRVFAIFQTLDASHSTDNTGIGLAIVKKIVETEGGVIWLESELGKGTTFCFTWSKQPLLTP